MASESSYYVPEQSKLPMSLGISMGVAAWGAGSVMLGSSPLVLCIGLFAIAVCLWLWFGQVIRENRAGLNNAQVKRSYVWGMSWFIFSEVMFFSVLFGALFYVRVFVLPWLSGEGDGTMNPILLWEGFEAEWPLMITPDQVVSGDAAKYVGPHETMSPWGLPLINTILLMTSSVTVHFAHTAIKNNKRKPFITWLAITVALAAVFLCVQAYEYSHAYNDLGLTLRSGIYGTTFFMLTGFHGFHVAMGTLMLTVQLVRGIKGHFSADDQFGFEATSWYWHFVDVVWVGLFIFVYVMGA